LHAVQPQARSLRLLIRQKPREYLSVVFLFMDQRMDKSRNLKYYDELDDQGQFEEFGCKTRPPRASRPQHESIVVEQFNNKFVQAQDDSHQAVTLTYQAARFEAGWLLDTLAGFLEQKWISDVLSKVKIGKEANVYLCRSGEAVATPLVVVKIYRPRMFRNLKNDFLYRDGRASLNEDGNIIRDLGMLKAQHKRSLFGEEIRLQSWIAYEYQTLQALHAAGVNVPAPYEMGANAILMGYIGDEQTAAPTLNTVPLERPEAEALYTRLLQDVDVMLSKGIVHGDLSAYNVLYWDGTGTLIDFPQVISPETNRNAWFIFRRDITRLCEYFIRQGLTIDPARVAADIWHRHGYHIQPDVHPALLDGNDPVDRQAFQDRDAD
jgi:RIO kinase 1